MTESPFLSEIGEVWPGTGRKRCCEEDFGGSHYHCGRCNKTSSMMGHYISLDGKSQWDRDFAKKIGVETPFEGFSCDPFNEMAP